MEKVEVEILDILHRHPYMMKPFLKYVIHVAESKETPSTESEAYKTFFREVEIARTQQAG